MRGTYVELGTTESRRDVQRDRLHAHEVLPAGQVLREREGDSGDALRWERDTLPAVGHRRDLVHLEPHVAVAGEAVDVTGGLGHVHVYDTGVVDRAIGHDAQRLTGLDGDRLRGRVRLGVVAAEVWGGDVRNGGLGVVVVRLADVDPSRGRGAVHDEGGEGVCACQSGKYRPSGIGGATNSGQPRTRRRPRGREPT